MTTRTYRNPFWSGPLADPFVLKVRGRYYAYGTEPADRPDPGSMLFPILHSPDLVHWEEAGRAMPALPHPYFRYWAPEVTIHNGRFLLYYAVHTEEFRATIRVAVADQPEGPFIDSGRDLTAAVFDWAIDPHVFRDVDGKWYLFCTVEYVEPGTELMGSGNAVIRLRDPFTVSGSPARVTPPRHAWQLFEAQRAAKNGVDWYCVEGPAVMRHRGRYYEMFSGGCYYRDNYAVSYAVAPAPMGTGGLRDESWQDSVTETDDQLMHGIPGEAISPGHNSIVLGPNNVDLYIAYHAWPADLSARRPCLDRLYWHGDTLWTPGPTVTAQPAPAAPRVQSLLAGISESLEHAWEVITGSWQLRESVAEQADASASEGLLRSRHPLGPGWLMEVHLRHLDGNGTYGVLLDGPHGPMRLVLELREPGSHDPSLSPRTVLPVPAGFEHAAWHQLLLAGSGESLSVTLDGVPVLDLLVDGPFESFTLLTDHCSAAFTAVTLTDHFRDEFLDDRRTPVSLGWYSPSGAAPGWHVRDGALVQSDADADGNVVLKGCTALQHFEFGATMSLKEVPASAALALGILAWHGDTGALAILLTHGDSGWTLRVEGRGDAASAVAALDLAPDFDPHAWHTLRVVRRDDTLTVYLDGPQVLTLPAPLGTGAPGLCTRRASAAFTGVWQTGLDQHTA